MDQPLTSAQAVGKPASAVTPGKKPPAFIRGVSRLSIPDFLGDYDGLVSGGLDQALGGFFDPVGLGRPVLWRQGFDFAFLIGSGSYFDNAGIPLVEPNPIPQL